MASRKHSFVLGSITLLELWWRRRLLLFLLLLHSSALSVVVTVVTFVVVVVMVSCDSLRQNEITGEVGGVELSL